MYLYIHLHIYVIYILSKHVKICSLIRTPQTMFIDSSTERSRGADPARTLPCVRISEHVRGLRINEHVRGLRINAHVPGVQTNEHIQYQYKFNMYVYIYILCRLNVKTNNKPTIL